MSTSQNRLPRVALAWGLSLFLILVGASASQAYWTSGPQTIAPTATSGTVEATQSGLSSLNGNVTRNSPTRSGTVTLTNTGSLDADWSYGLASTSKAVPQTTFNLWPRAAGQNCTSATPSGGTSATGKMPAALTGHFVPGETVTLCVRVTVSSQGARTYAGTALALTGTLRASLGNWTGGGPANSTVSIADTDAPSAPSLTIVRTSGYSARLTWTASTDNAGVAGYKVYRGNTLVTTLDGSTLTYTDASLSANTSYGFYVQAFDLAGNSANSSTSNIRTLNVVSNTKYDLYASYSGLCVDVWNWGWTVGSGLAMWDCTGATNQQFAFRPVGDGSYLLEPQNSVDTAAGVPDSDWGTQVELTSKTDTGNQWLLEPLRDGFALQNVTTGLYMDVEGISSDKGTALTQWDRTGAVNQAFVLRTR